MARRRPCVLVVGAKGGVGATTVAAMLYRFAPVPIVGFDLTGTNQLAPLVGEVAASAVEVVRRRSRMAGVVARELRRRRRFVFATTAEASFFADGIRELVRMVANRRATIVDAGESPNAGLLDVATTVLLVTIPDVRALHALEGFLKRYKEHAHKVRVVENMAAGASLVPQGVEAIRLPRGPADFRKLMRGEMGRTLKALAAELFPVPEQEEEEEPRGIIRHLLKE